MKDLHKVAELERRYKVTHFGTDPPAKRVAVYLLSASKDVGEEYHIPPDVLRTKAGVNARTPRVRAVRPPILASPGSPDPPSDPRRCASSLRIYSEVYARLTLSLPWCLYRVYVCLCVNRMCAHNNKQGDPIMRTCVRLCFPCLFCGRRLRRKRAQRAPRPCRGCASFPSTSSSHSSSQLQALHRRKHRLGALATEVSPDSPFIPSIPRCFPSQRPTSYTPAARRTPSWPPNGSPASCRHRRRCSC